MPLTACTIQEVLSTDNPNEGRVKINNNFNIDLGKSTAYFRIAAKNSL